MFSDPHAPNTPPPSGVHNSPRRTLQRVTNMFRAGHNNTNGVSLFPFPIPWKKKKNKHDKTVRFSSDDDVVFSYDPDEAIHSSVVSGDNDDEMLYSLDHEQLEREPEHDHYEEAHGDTLLQETTESKEIRNGNGNGSDEFDDGNDEDMFPLGNLADYHKHLHSPLPQYHQQHRQQYQQSNQHQHQPQIILDEHQHIPENIPLTAKQIKIMAICQENALAREQEYEEIRRQVREEYAAQQQQRAQEKLQKEKSLQYYRYQIELEELQRRRNRDLFVNLSRESYLRHALLKLGVDCVDYSPQVSLHSALPDELLKWTRQHQQPLSEQEGPPVEMKSEDKDDIAISNVDFGTWRSFLVENEQDMSSECTDTPTLEGEIDDNNQINSGSDDEGITLKHTENVSHNDNENISSNCNTTSLGNDDGISLSHRSGEQDPLPGGQHGHVEDEQDSEQPDILDYQNDNNFEGIEVGADIKKEISRIEQLESEDELDDDMGNHNNHEAQNEVEEKEEKKEEETEEDIEELRARMKKKFAGQAAGMKDAGDGGRCNDVYDLGDKDGLCSIEGGEGVITPLKDQDHSEVNDIAALLDAARNNVGVSKKPEEILVSPCEQQTVPVDRIVQSATSSANDDAHTAHIPHLTTPESSDHGDGLQDCDNRDRNVNTIVGQPSTSVASHNVDGTDSRAQQKTVHQTVSQGVGSHECNKEDCAKESLASSRDDGEKEHINREENDLQVIDEQQRIDHSLGAAVVDSRGISREGDTGGMQHWIGQSNNQQMPAQREAKYHKEEGIPERKRPGDQADKMGNVQESRGEADELRSTVLQENVTLKTQQGVGINKTEEVRSDKSVEVQRNALEGVIRGWGEEGRNTVPQGILTGDGGAGRGKGNEKEGGSAVGHLDPEDKDAEGWREDARLLLARGGANCEGEELDALWERMEQKLNLESQLAALVDTDGECNEDNDDDDGDGEGATDMVVGRTRKRRRLIMKKLYVLLADSLVCGGVAGGEGNGDGEGEGEKVGRQ